jgi:hypothetical protein
MADRIGGRRGKFGRELEVEVAVTFASAATYDVVMSAGSLGIPAELSFDAGANPVTSAR